MPVLRVSYDIYNLDDAKDLHRYTGHLVDFYKKIETPEVAETPDKKRGKNVMEQAEKQIELPIEEQPVDLTTLDRAQLDAKLKEVAPGKGGVVWFREILAKYSAARASDLTDEQMRQVLAG